MHPKIRHFEQSAGDLYKKIRRENRLTHDPVAMTDHLSSLPNCSKFRAKASFAYTNAPKKSNLRCLWADLVVSAIFLHFATQLPTVRVPVNAREAQTGPLYVHISQLIFSLLLTSLTFPVSLYTTILHCFCIINSTHNMLCVDGRGGNYLIIYMAFIQFLRSTMSDQSELRMTYVTWLPYKELTPSNSICPTTPPDVL